MKNGVCFCIELYVVEESLKSSSTLAFIRRAFRFLLLLHPIPEEKIMRFTNHHHRQKKDAQHI